MNSNYLRRKTVLVVQKDGLFLVGLDIFGKLNWSRSIYDAWSTRNIDDACAVAKKVCGGLWLFNPIVGQKDKVMDVIRETFKSPECRNCKDCVLKVKKNTASGIVTVGCRRNQECGKKFTQEVKNHA